MTCSLDTYRQRVGSFAFGLDKILHRKAKLASWKIRTLRCCGFAAWLTVLSLILALLLRAGVERNPGPNAPPAPDTHGMTTRTARTAQPLGSLTTPGLLHRCGDIESNPEPNKKMHQTRLASAGRYDDSAAASPPRPAPAGGKEPTLRDVLQTLLTMNTKLDEVKEELREMKNAYKEPTLRDVLQTLLTMNTKLDEVKEELREMKNAYTGMREEM